MINYVAVLVSAIVGFVIGGLWYSPLLFGKTWMKLMNITQKEMKANKDKAKKGYIFMFVALLVMAYTLALFVNYAGATTLTAGLLVGFWAWLGFVATVLLGGFLWENKPFSLYLINVSHYLVVLVVMGAILAVWV